MNKLLTVSVAAALIGAAAVVFSGVITSEEAHSTPAVVKGDRLDIKTSIGPQCSQGSWPYYETSCLRNTVSALREARPVRIVSQPGR